MTNNFRDTPEGDAFVASGASRETSREIMEAIAFFADNKAEAEALWEGEGFGVVCNPSDLWEHVTGNGLRDPADYCWGASGTRWWSEIEQEEGE